MDDHKPLWKTTVTVAPGSGGLGTTMAVATSSAIGSAPDVPFMAIVRRPGATFGDPTNLTATRVRVTAMSGGSISAMTRDLGGASTFPILVGDEVYQDLDGLFGNNRETRYIDGLGYDFTLAEVRRAYADLQAFNSGIGKILVRPNNPIICGSTEPLNIVTSCSLIAPRSSYFLKPSTNRAFTPICVNVPQGIGGTVSDPGITVGLQGSQVALNGTWEHYKNVIPLATTAAFAVGDEIIVTQATDANPALDTLESDFRFPCRIHALDATHLYVDTPAPMDVTVAYSAKVQKVTYTENVRIEAYINNGSNTGVGGGFFGEFMGRGCEVDIYGTELLAFASYLYHSRDLKKYHSFAEHCGENTIGANSLQYFNGVEDLNLTSRNAYFHGNIIRGGTLKHGYLEANNGLGRQIKIHHVWDSFFDSCIANASEDGVAGETGVEVTGSSDNVTIGYIQTHYNWSSGIYCAGPNLASKHIRFIRGDSFQNGKGGGGAVDVTISSGAEDWDMGRVNFSTLSDNGLRSQLGSQHPKVISFSAGAYVGVNGDFTATSHVASYILDNYMMEFMVSVTGTAANTPSNITINIPGGWKVRQPVSGPAWISTNAVAKVGFWLANAIDDTTINVYLDAVPTDFTNGTNIIKFTARIPVYPG